MFSTLTTSFEDEDDTLFFQPDQILENEDDETQTTQLFRMFISCKNLSTEFLERCDPMVILFLKKDNGTCVELGRTESIIDEHNPFFTKSIVIDRYFIENLSRTKDDFGRLKMKEILKFLVVSCPRNDQDEIEYNHLIGESDWSIDQITQSEKRAMSLALRLGPIKYGILDVSAELVTSRSNETSISYQFAASNIPQLDLVSLSDPFFVIERKIGLTNYWHPIYKSEARTNTRNPHWARMETNLSHLCNGNMHRNLRFSVYDWDSSVQKSLIGKFTVKVSELLKGKDFQVSLAKGMKGTTLFYILDRNLKYNGTETNLEGNPLSIEEIESSMMKEDSQFLKFETKNRSCCILM